MEAALNFDDVGAELETLLESITAKHSDVELGEFINDEKIRTAKRAGQKKEKTFKKISGNKPGKSVGTVMKEGYALLLKELEALGKTQAQMDASIAGYQQAKDNSDRLHDKIEGQKETINKHSERLQKMVDKKTEILDNQKKEMNQQVEKVETFRKDLEKKLKTYHLERSTKVKKYEIQKEENQKLQEHLQKIESEIENQRTSYNDDYDKKRKNIETHQEKLSETLHQFEDEIKKIPEYEEEKNKVQAEYDEAKEIDSILEARYKDLSGVMNNCDSFFKIMKKNMTSIKKVMNVIENDISKKDKSNKRSNDSLVTQIKKNLKTRKDIEKEVLSQKKYQKIFDDYTKKKEELEA